MQLICNCIRSHVITNINSFCCRKTKTGSTSQHKQQLEKLKDKDPEFYKFLQENDSELLDFENMSSGSDDDGDEDEGEEDGDDKEKVGSEGDEDESEDENEVKLDSVKKFYALNPEALIW